VAIVPRPRSQHLLAGIDRIDRGNVLIGVGLRLDRGIFALLGRGLAFRQHAQDAVDGDYLAALVHLHVAAHGNDRAAGELALLYLAGLFAVEAVDRVAGPHRAIEVPRRARDEHVDSFEQALAQALDLVRDGIALHRCVDLRDHHARRDHPAPTRATSIVGIAI
jgi:hypothetical protein